jgi:hypothetical protein
MAEDNITRLLQNAELEEILPEDHNADGSNVAITLLLYSNKYFMPKTFFI